MSRSSLPDSVSRDWREKYLDYESAGVREYWVIDPNAQRVEAYALNSENRYLRINEKDDKIASTVLSGFYLRPSWLWQQPLPLTATILREIAPTP